MTQFLGPPCVQTQAPSYTVILTKAYIDDEEVGDVKRQNNDFRKQHNVQLQLPVKISRTTEHTNKHRHDDHH